ncbi:superoxide dismutase family protein [Saccharomonospora sp. NPDC006951]
MKRHTLAVLLSTATVVAGSAFAGTSGAEAAVGPFAGARGTFGPYSEGRVATTYDPSLVPSGATGRVYSMSGKNTGTFTTLSVSGLRPERQYGAHVHVKPCGSSGGDAGPHFQNVVDPAAGTSTDPAYANPDNEIWLDFTTSKRGAALASSHVEWAFGERKPASVVIHEHGTSTEHGHAGDAGARLACINVDF